MSKLILITVVLLVAFIAEFLLFNIYGVWFTPNLILLVVIFFDLYFGIRHGIFAAFLGGLLEDSFSTGFFGINIVALVISAYAAVFFKKYFYQHNVKMGRFFLIVCVCVVNILVHYILYVLVAGVGFLDVFKHILFPETLLTLLVANFTFKQLKQCVLKFSV